MELLEQRALLAPFSVGGDPSVHAADFRVTTFASGLNYPTGVLAEPDGSMLVVVNNPVTGSTSFFNSTAQVLRLVDTNGDGVADGTPTVLASNLPGADSAIAQAGPYVITTSSNGVISFLHTGATPTSPLTLAGAINLSFPSGWWHTTYSLATRPAPGSPGDYNVFFNVGSQFNGIKKDANGNILYDSNGVAIPDPTVGTVTASGLISGTLTGDGIYMVTLHDNSGTPTLSGLTKIATGLRNAASMAIDPATGDLIYADNGIDGTSGGNEAYSTDTLQRISAASIGQSVPNDGFPYSYTLTNLTPGSPNTVVNPGQGVPPLIAFQPLRDPNLPTTGSESEGASGFAIAPPLFPAGLNQGVFIGFHGIFNSGGTSNEENPLLFADPNSGKYFDFISNDEPSIGHLDGATSTSDSLFLADMTSAGNVSGNPGNGFIYQIKSRGLPNTDGWQGYARDSQHSALSPYTSDGLGSIAWHTPTDLNPQYSGNDLLIHYGSPMITSANTVLVPVKTGASGGFEVQAYSGSTGALEWTLPSDYALMPSSGTNGYSWTPSYSPTLTPGNVLYYSGDGGTIIYTASPDAAGPSPPASTRLAFYGLSNYNANPSAYNTTVYINTPITSDASGNIYFGYLVTGSNPLGLTSGVARIAPDGTATYTPVVSGMSQVATNSAPALSNDGSTLYVLETTGNGGSGKLVAMNSQTLAVTGQASLYDVVHTTSLAPITNDATSSPMVGPDGHVYIGVLETPFASNHDRGWLLQFNSTLTQELTPGDFGWDDTPSVVPASMVPSYTGNSTYLLMSKYNNYAGYGGGGANKVAVLDPNATETDPATGATVMKEVLTILGPTPDPEFDQQYPGAVKEWCINSAAVDPATDSILVNSEDGVLYRWNLSTNSFTQKVTLTSGIGEAYTPTLIGPDGTVYAVNNATLFAVRGNSSSGIASASFLGTDSTRHGNWMGTYGSQGYNVIGNAAAYPAYATVTASGQLTHIWQDPTTDTRALQYAVGSGRIAACWYSGTSFTVDVNVADGNTHNIELYVLDWDANGRIEQIQLSNATTGAVLDTETAHSFSGGTYLAWTISGHVLITFTFESATFTSNAVLSGIFFDPAGPLPPPPPPTPPPPTATATFVGKDTTTQGNWHPTYGNQGYYIINSGSVAPSYATVTPAGNSSFIWEPNTTAPQALVDAPGTNPSTRIAACWYRAPSFTVDVNVTDGNTHNIELYLLDWDNNGRVEQIQLSNATTGSVLDTETVQSFSAGTYLAWTISGHVLITITLQSPASSNAVLSGIFFDPAGPLPAPAPTASATFVGNDTTTQGNWHPTYGNQGYYVINSGSVAPSYATVTPAGNSSFTWEPNTTAPQALVDAPGTNPSTRIAACWYRAPSFTVDVNVTDGNTHNIELYLLDWDNNGRAEQIQLSNANTHAVLDTETVQSFSGGTYMAWTISGNVLITITLQSPSYSNAVLSGIFFDPAGQLPPPPTATATFAGKDTTMQGNWNPTYGSEGYYIINSGSVAPSYATVTPAGNSSFIWQPNTTAPQALVDAPGTNPSTRIAACWYRSPSFTVDVNVTDGNKHNIELYLLDWDNNGRMEQIQLSNATTGAVLDTETASSFSQGVYLKWTISGNVLITFTLQSPSYSNAVLSGIFFDPPPPSAPARGSAIGGGAGAGGTDPGSGLSNQPLSVIQSGKDITTQGALRPTATSLANDGFNSAGVAPATSSGQYIWSWDATSTNNDGPVAPRQSADQAGSPPAGLLVRASRLRRLFS
jgi:glucose/arabinose dehydrogenase